MAKVPPVPAEVQAYGQALDPAVFQRIAGKDGRVSAKDLEKQGGAGVLPTPPKGYSYTYQFDNPNAPLSLKKDSSLGKTLAKVGILAAAGVGTAMTGGALAPVLIGAAAGAGTGAIDNGWKGALMGAGLGAAGGAAGGSLLGGAAKGAVGSSLGSALKNPSLYAGIGGQVIPGPAGSALSMASGLGGGNMAAAGGASGILKELLKNPEFYSTVGGTVAGMAKGSAESRAATDNANLVRDRTQGDLYQTQQSALNQILQMAEKANMDRANLGITAPSARTSQLIRGSLLQNMKPFSVTPTSSKVKIPTISGGLTPAALSAMARQGGGELQKQALQALISKSDIPAQQDYKGALLGKPELAPLSKPGAMETAGSILGPLLAAYGQMQQKGQPTPPQQSGGTNQMPAPYTGRDQYGNPTNWTLARPGMAPPPPTATAAAFRPRPTFAPS